MRTDSIRFAVKDGRCLHELPLGRTLSTFIGFDFAPFRERCIEAGRDGRKRGELSPSMEDMARTELAKCHPYVRACMGNEYSQAVIDCIIDCICFSENISAEGLWFRCISPVTDYEKAIFDRLCAYRTGRASNQWVNVLRIREYAMTKAEFIYRTGGDRHVKREYFDLAFGVAADNVGCGNELSGSFRICSPAELAVQTQLMGRTAKSIAGRLSFMLDSAEHISPRLVNESTCDKVAMDIFSYLRDMPPPEENELGFAADELSMLPDNIYFPDSFKGAVDMELYAMEREDVPFKL